MTHYDTPLSDHAHRTRDCDQKFWHDKCMNGGKDGYGGGGWAWLILVFIIILVIVWIILFAVNPESLQKKDDDGNPTGEADAGRTFVAALVIAIVLCLICGLFYGAARR